MPEAKEISNLNARHDSASARGRTTGAMPLLAWLAGIGGLWLIALPALSRCAPVAGKLERLDRQGVDASAMYYTELEAMKPILERINRRGRTPPASR